MKKFTVGLVLLAVLLMPVSASAETLIPGGQVIGIKLGEPLTVAAFAAVSAARWAVRAARCKPSAPLYTQ